MITVSRYFGSTRQNPDKIAFSSITFGAFLQRSIWQVPFALILALIATLAALTFAGGTAQAHTETYCDSGHYITDENSMPPGRYMTYAESSHDHLVVKSGGGITGISVATRSSNVFYYSGVRVEVNSSQTVFEITFTTTTTDTVMKICFEDNLGLWFPLPLDVNAAPNTKNLPIPRQDVEITGGADTLNLSNYFEDPNNDTLTYSAESSDTNKATTSVSSSTLSITPVEEGVVTITVTASDSIDSVQATFTAVIYRKPADRTSTEMSGIVDPNEETVVTSKNGDLTVTFPAGSMSEFFQARIDPESDDCGSQAPQGNEYLCLSVDLFDLEATVLADESLDQDATMELSLDQTQANAVQTAIDADTFSLYKGDAASNSWTEIPKCPDPVGTSECYQFETTTNGGTIKVVNISGFSDFTTSIPTSGTDDVEQTVTPPQTQTVNTRGSSTGGGGSPSRSNQRPSLNGDGSLRYQENGTGPVETYSAKDPDNDKISWHVEGADRKAFEISNDGDLNFKSPPDFENPVDGDGDNDYEITVRVSDDGSPSRDDEISVVVSVTNRNELGDIIGDADLSLPEGESGLLKQYQAIDPEADDINWSISGPDSGNFRIDQEGMLYQESVFDYEAPSSAAGSNVYSLTITAADDGSPQETSELEVSVSVSNVNEAPTTTGIPGLELNVGDMQANLVLDDVFSDPDGDSLSYTLAGDEDTGVAAATLTGNTLSITPAGVGSLSLEVTASDAGGLSVSATASVTVVDNTVDETPLITRTPIHWEIIAPVSIHFAEPGAALGVTYLPGSFFIPYPFERPVPSDEPSRGPIPSTSPRMAPELTPAPTAAPAPAPVVAPTPTARPTPIPSTIAVPTRAAEPTQVASQAPPAPQPTPVPIVEAPTVPQPTAVPTLMEPTAPEPTTASPQESTPAEEGDDSDSRFPLWLIILLILLVLFTLAFLPLWIVNLAIIGGLIALAIALASLPLWLTIPLAVAALLLLAAVGLVYGIVTRGW